MNLREMTSHELIFGSRKIYFFCNYLVGFIKVFLMSMALIFLASAFRDHSIKVTHF